MICIPATCVANRTIVACLLTGGGGKGWHGKSQTGQQADLVQSVAGTRGPTFPAVQPQEHGEPSS